MWQFVMLAKTLDPISNKNFADRQFILFMIQRGVIADGYCSTNGICTAISIWFLPG